jgi:hypothetical protein
MSICQDIGKWITDNIEQPIERWRNDAYQECTDARRWLEERRTEFESWWRSQATRCLEQPCQWICLCCNKWLCWLVDILVRILTIVVQIIEHVIEAVCKLIVTIIWLLVMVLVQIVKWVVLSVVCLLEALCSLFVLMAGLALLAFLLAIVALGVPALAPVASPWIPVAIVVALAALVLARVLCELGRCRLPGVVGWALKWAIVLGAALALFMMGALSGVIVTIYGGLLAGLMHALKRIGCQVPRMLGLP